MTVKKPTHPIKDGLNFNMINKNYLKKTSNKECTGEIPLRYPQVSTSALSKRALTAGFCKQESACTDLNYYLLYNARCV